MKVLLLSYYYPPDRAVGGQRAQKVTEALRAAGHDVTVIAAGRPETESEGLVRIRPLASIRDLYARMRRRSRETRGGSSPGVEAMVNGSGRKSAAVSRWKRWIFSFIWLPDDRQGYVLPAVWRAMRDSAGRPDLIYSTAPPFSVHLAGLLLRGITGARWVAEFRDPWTSNPWKPAEMRSAFSDWMERKLEWLCLETADLLVPVSEGIASRLVEGGATTPFTIVRNGIENLRTPEEAETDALMGSPIEIVYAGSFYHSRNPFPFLAAVKRMVAEKALSPADLRVRFIGETQAYEGCAISEYLREQGLEDYVNLEGWMQPEQSLGRIQAADILLLLAIDQPDQVPNKLYEYLGARRPILAVADAGGETARMLDLVGGHRVVPINDPELIRSALMQLVGGGDRRPVGRSEVLGSWTTPTQMSELCASLGA